MLVAEPGSPLLSLYWLKRAEIYGAKTPFVED